MRTTLGILSDDDLAVHPAWEATGDIEDGDKVLVPAAMVDGAVSAATGEVWCRSECVFANGDRHPATAMYRGDGPEGPLAWTVSCEGEEMPLIVPPAPDFVLQLDGPSAFAQRFSLPTEAVFPLEIRSAVRFESPPAIRSVFLAEDGVLQRT
jgi:hypothetical protein